jgi:hypothetical protein
MSERVFSTAALLEGDGGVRLINGWAFQASKEAAIGFLMGKIKEEFPDYKVADFACMEVPEDKIQAAAFKAKP